MGPTLCFYASLIIHIAIFVMSVELKNIPERTLNDKTSIRDKIFKDTFVNKVKEKPKRDHFNFKSRTQTTVASNLATATSVLDDETFPGRLPNKTPKRNTGVIYERIDSPVEPTVLESIYAGSPKTPHNKRRNADILDDKGNLFSVLWTLLRPGQQQTSEDDIASLENTKASIMPRMVNGTALVVASCDVSIVHAAMSKNNTVISIFLDHSSSQECESRILKKNLANVFVSHMDGNEIINSIMLSLARNVHFDFIFILELERLTSGLLPQEIEDVVKKLLSSSRVLLFSLEFQDNKTFRIFKSSWKEPKDLVHNVCARFVDGSCFGAISGGFETSWVPLYALFKNNKSEESDGCENKGLPLHLLLSHNLTSNSRRKLFTSLVEFGLVRSVEDDVYIHDHIVIKSLCQSLESQSSRTGHFSKGYTKLREKSQSGWSTSAASKDSTTVFDIVDGRPVEEESTLTKGYRELGQDEDESKYQNNNTTEAISISKKELPKDTKQPRIVSGSARKIHQYDDIHDFEKAMGNKFQKNRLNSEREGNDFLIKTIFRPDSKAYDDRSALSNTLDDVALKTSTSTAGGDEWNKYTSAGTPFTDESRYKFVLDALTPHLNEMFKNGKSVNGLLSGGCHLSMLSAKLSMKHPGVNLITLDTDKQQDCSDKFGSILDSAEISNNFMLRDDLSPDVVYQISHIPQLFDFQVLGPEVFSRMLQTGRAFLDYFARILSMSRVTFVEVPSWESIRATVRLFQRNHTLAEDYDSFQDFLSAAVLTTNSKLFHVEDISKSLQGATEKLQLWKVELQTFERKVFTTCHDSRSSSSSSVKMIYNRPTPILVSGDGGTTPPTWRWRGLNLKTLLSFDVSRDHRRKLFESYLRVPLYEDMCPCRLFWSRGRLRHADQTLAPREDTEQLQTLTQFINSQIHQNIFSFVDYNSQNKYVGTTLARKHPRSTFVLTEDSATSATSKAQQAERVGLNNTLVLHLPVTQEFSRNLLKSPDIVRYQFIDLVKLLVTYDREAHRYTFMKMVGELLSTGLTSFVIVPSSEILSLATSTMFPGVFDSRPHVITSDNHLFKNAEKTLLKQTADMGKRRVRLHSTLHPSVSWSGTKGARPPWRLNTVRILRLQQKVDHHFHFELDQHERKYIQHVEREGPKHQPRVYLVREEDDYRIDYGNVSAISLIALLRMGILPSTREKLYSLFIQLPLHEDMAPWNIVFQGGQLSYIDQDTRDKTFDELIPMAYQLLSVLINYERTVNDLKHCGEKANTQYNFGQISSCVRSQFQGPCHDSRYPVPCGDMTCQPTYIHCLRALQHRMHHKRDSGTSWQGMRKGLLVDESREWEFDDADIKSFVK